MPCSPRRQLSSRSTAKPKFSPDTSTCSNTVNQFDDFVMISHDCKLYSSDQPFMRQRLKSENKQKVDKGNCIFTYSTVKHILHVDISQSHMHNGKEKSGINYKCIG